MSNASINSRYRGGGGNEPTGSMDDDDLEEILGNRRGEGGDDEVVVSDGRNNNVPADKFNFNYIAFYLLGMTTLLPWNFFVTAEDVSISLQIKLKLIKRKVNFLSENKITYLPFFR